MRASIIGIESDDGSEHLVYLFPSSLNTMVTPNRLGHRVGRCFRTGLLMYPYWTPKRSLSLCDNCKPFGRKTEGLFCIIILSTLLFERSALPLKIQPSKGHKLVCLENQNLIQIHVDFRNQFRHMKIFYFGKVRKKMVEICRKRALLGDMPF